MSQTGTLPAQRELSTLLIQQQPEFAKALPGHISPEKFVRTAQTAIALTRGIEKLKDRQSLLAACTKAAADGLILDGREAALVIDYKGVAQYRPMVRGLKKLAYNSGQIRGLVIEIVGEADEFDYEPTRVERPVTHKINLRKPRGDVYAVYAQAELIGGGIIAEVMTVDQVNRIRDRADAYKAFKAGKIKSTPWHTDWEEMARKTVFRRLSKSLPGSADREDRFHQAVERIDEDYSFDDEPGPQARPAKKRGGAAEALRDVTPKDETPPKSNGKAASDAPPPEQNGEARATAFRDEFLRVVGFCKSRERLQQMLDKNAEKLDRVQSEHPDIYATIHTAVENAMRDLPDADPPHDPETGEVIDGDAEMQPGDDI